MFLYGCPVPSNHSRKIRHSLFQALSSQTCQIIHNNPNHNTRSHEYQYELYKNHSACRQDLLQASRHKHLAKGVKITKVTNNKINEIQTSTITQESGFLKGRFLYFAVSFPKILVASFGTLTSLFKAISATPPPPPL